MKATIAELETKNNELQMELERNKGILQDNFSNESDAKLQIDDLAIKESEVSTFVHLQLVSGQWSLQVVTGPYKLQLKNRNLELEIVYLRCHIRTFEGDANEQSRQHQSEQGAYWICWYVC